MLLRRLGGVKIVKVGGIARDHIHYTAQWSGPSAGGLSRLSGTDEDRQVRDWFRQQITELGAKTYTVNATGSRFATFVGENGEIPPIAMGSHLDSVATGGRFDGPLGVIGALEVVRSMKELGIKTRAPITVIKWTNEEGARFFPPLGSSGVYAGQSSSIGYVGDGPNTFEEFPISAHFEIHVEQATDLEKAGKPVGWVEGWQGISVFEVTFKGEDGHANTYPMHGRRDSLVGASRLICDLEQLAYDVDGYTTTTNIQSGPVGSCNIQSWTKVVFCLMHKELGSLESMGNITNNKAKSIAARHGLELEFNRIMHLEPGNFWPEAVDCVKRACGDKGIASNTMTAHDSTMTRLLCPTAMVFARAKDGISHCAREWTSKEDCVESAVVLGKAVLNFDQLLADKAGL